MAFRKYDPNPVAKAKIDWDREHMVHWVYPIGLNCGFIMDHADGISYYDSEGFQIYDGSSQLMCVELGYRKEYMEEVAAVASEQLKKLPMATNFWGMVNDATVAAGQELQKIVPEGLDAFWFAPGGGEAVESALQVCRWYWKNQGTQKYKFISLENCYHGMYWGTATASKVGRGEFSNYMAPMVPGFLAAPDYYCYRCTLNHKYPECGIECVKQIDKIIQMEDKETVAGVIVEVEHGTAGSVPSPREYLPMLREICDRNEVSLIVDEVMTGFGRCSEGDGNAFACQITGVTPDFMTMAKGITSAYIPLGAVAITREIADGLEGHFTSGPTYAAHPVSCAVAAKVMEIYQRDRIFEHAAKVGAYAKQQIQERLIDTSPIAQSVTGYGLLLGIELVKDKETGEDYPPESHKMMRVQDRALDKGLYIRVCDKSFAPGNRFVFAPPLVTTEAEVDAMIDILDETLKEELASEYAEGSRA
jgi:taurine--2-oxoglutarate transaminase